MQNTNTVRCHTCTAVVSWAELRRHQVSCRELTATRQGMENGAWQRVLDAAARRKARQSA